MTATKKVDHEARILELENAISKIAQIAEAVERHEKILKGGDNDKEKGLLERTRGIESSIESASGWLRAIVMLFAAQFVAVIFAVISFIIKISPALVKLAE